MKNTTVFIVDDHYMVIEGIRSLLHQEPGIELVGHASNAASCMAFIKSKQPDVILMDISMPDQSGVDLCKVIREMYPATFVIGLSTFNQFTYIDKMMENGASGYLLKNADKKEIVAAIHAVAKGQTFLSDEAAGTLKNAAQESAVLTRREKEVLQLIAEGMTNPAIAAKLYLSITTVDTHRKSLMRKLHAKNTAVLIRYAIEHKLV